MPSVLTAVLTSEDPQKLDRCLKSLNISPTDGVIRISLVHYNSINEVNHLIEVLEKI